MSKPTNAMIEDTDYGTGTFKFQLMPEGLSDSDAANFQPYPILGRSWPLFGYQDGQARGLEISVSLFANPEQGDSSMSPADIKKWTDWLMGLPYPNYNGGIKPPPRCLITIGSNVKFKGVCTNASVDYNPTWPWDSGPGYAHGVTIRLQFQATCKSPLGITDRQGGSYE